MKRTAYAQTRVLVSLPMYLIALMWIMLWFLWPHGKMVQVKRRVIPPSRVTFVTSVAGLYNRPFPTLAGKVAENGRDDEAHIVPWFEPRPSRLLDRQAAMLSNGKAHKDDLLSPAAIEALNTYSPVWDDPAVYAVRGGGEMQLTVEPSRELAKSGFSVPEIGAGLKPGDKPWFVVLFVEVGADGRVKNVFVDKGSENKDVNTALVKAAYRGTAQAGAECEGRIKINFGQ
jgi:hypothetical protein